MKRMLLAHILEAVKGNCGNGSLYGEGACFACLHMRSRCLPLVDGLLVFWRSSERYAFPRVQIVDYPGEIA